MGSTLQTSSARIVPPIHLHSVDEENLLLPLDSSVEAQGAQTLELRAEKNLSELAILKVWARRLWKVFGDENLITSCVGVIFVAGSHEIADDGRIGSSIIAADVCRRNVEPIRRVVVERS